MTLVRERPRPMAACMDLAVNSSEYTLIKRAAPKRRAVRPVTRVLWRTE